MRFDYDLLAADMAATRLERGLSIRESATKSGVSRATFFRLGRGGRCSIDSFAKLCEWMDIPPSAYFYGRKTLETR